MNITKYAHACLLVETPERVALFDPGEYSTVDPAALTRLDDVFITHKHQDHMDVNLIKRLQAQFPDARITAPADAGAVLGAAGVANVQTSAPEGVRLFDAPHETLKPLATIEPLDEYGYHYAGLLSHPGDSFHFTETMPVLALPVNGGPWGAPVGAAAAALTVKPQYVIPIHDWHWRDEAREHMYKLLETRLHAAGITFINAVNGEPVELDVTATA